MTKFILVRHGEPTYQEVLELGFKGHGLALAPLTECGIQKIKDISESKVFYHSDLLISSPYTRAMQTASIIGHKHNLDVNVEILLHEWLPDLTHNYQSEEEFLTNIRIAKNEWQQQQKGNNLVLNSQIESLQHVRQRGLDVLARYCDYQKVIVVAHGLLISMISPKLVKLKPGEFTVITSEQLEQCFDFKPKVLTKK